MSLCSICALDTFRCFLFDYFVNNKKEFRPNHGENLNQIIEVSKPQPTNFYLRHFLHIMSANLTRFTANSRTYITKNCGTLFCFKFAPFFSTLSLVSRQIFLFQCWYFFSIYLQSDLNTRLSTISFKLWVFADGTIKKRINTREWLMKNAKTN